MKPLGPGGNCMIYCQACGQSNGDDAAFCSACGAAINRPQANASTPAPAAPAASPAPRPPAQGSPEYVPNYLVQSILLMLFCCLPFGIVALVYASGVNSKLAMGDIAGARAASISAKNWCWAAFATGLGIELIYVLFVVIGAAASSY